ncbi:large subunit corrinoid FeS protein of CODH/ACS complex AscC [Candidatus Scalindua japonica]|uniref:Large subunit corrinoid FeS protein of CODH/ACS complex AscC n=1 Tax=Candidatus Scalindua japonica TaxID=1284222 RepID=A0A286TV41_9BACT|nr:acetyl-CoA decarbonylase/synthase complex subunit gamma [Candidatus Scalindua japonica]GAX59749.1 large subunit corrinoid FeS protein of CODH/ACS complex AscC [Candidatus Scalindua japonica]
MALTGLEIFKLLPKTNCKKCGRATCLAFAMQLAQKKAELKDCPDVSEEAKGILGAASAPPIKLVSIGAGDKQISVGEENVLFRHDEKFYNPTGVAVTLSDDLDDDAFSEKLNKINNLKFTRVGTEIEIDLVALLNNSGDGTRFAERAKQVSENTHLSIILESKSPENMKSAVETCSDKKPLICGANADNWEAMANIAKDKGCPMTVSASTLEELADLAEKIKGIGVTDIVLNQVSESTKDILQGLTIIRRAALKKAFRQLGYPALTYMPSYEPAQEIASASVFIAKYAGIVVVNAFEPWQIMPLLTVRQNIYTDPQKPVQVEPKLYEVGQVNENSPVLFTTNFSLTYYTVEGEVEASRIPAYILAVGTEGTSVLTAYSGDKLNEDVIAKAMSDANIEEKVKHKKLIVPGLVAILSAKIQEKTKWEALVGPKEASGLPTYLKSTWN